MVEPAHRRRAETGRPDPSICSVVVSGVSLSFQDVSVTDSQPTGSSEQQPPKDILDEWANAANPCQSLEFLYRNIHTEVRRHNSNIIVVDQPQKPHEKVAACPCRQVEGSRTSSIILEDNTAAFETRQ